MIDFDYTEDERLLQATVRDFAKHEIAPHARRWDQEERYPMELVPKLAALGLLGMSVPEEYGGSAMTMSQIALVIEELARVDGSVALGVAAHNGLCTGHIKLAGNAAQKQQYLPRLASGQALGAWGFSPEEIAALQAEKAIGRRT